MSTGTVMLACIVITAVCGLIMHSILKKRDTLLEAAIVAENTEDITRTSNHGKIPFVIALVIGALAAGMLFVLIMASVFSGAAILFAG